MARGGWVYVGGRAGNKPPAAEKAAIAVACEDFIAGVLTPKYLPKVIPTKWNYPVELYGKWLGNKYRFLTHFRCDNPEYTKTEFNLPFARLEYVSHDLFDLSWHRHTGEWRCVFERVSLKEGLRLIETEPFLRPPC
ncbi:MAG: hypothetical protein EXR07_10010 [Acetobacteraceae bacterium]|nr:hypothetical protein [Acetobacteraceae bacterium]